MQRLFLVFLLALVLLATGVWLLLENPDRFKNQIASTVSSGAGYQLQLEGELSWRYWPPIAIQANAVSVDDSQGEPIATFDRLIVDVDLMPLLTQGLITDINLLTIEGGTLNLAAAAKKPISKTAGVSSSQARASVAPVIHEFLLTDIDIQLEDDGRLYIATLTTSRLGTDIPFDAALTGRFTDKGADLQLSGSGNLLYASDTGRISFDDLLIEQSGELNEKALPTVRVLAEGEWRPEEEAIVIRQADISTNALQVSLTGISKFSPLRFDGIVELESANLPMITNQFDVDAPFDTLQLKSGLQITTDAIALQTLEGQFDNTQFKGQLSSRFGDHQELKADLRLDSYKMPERQVEEPSTPANSAKSARSAMPTELIPVELLKGMVIDAIVRIEKLQSANQLFTDTKIELHNTREKAQLTINTGGYEGRLVLSAGINLADPIDTDLILNVSDINVSSLMDSTDITGSLTGNAQLQFSGTTFQDLSDTLMGRTVFDISNGTISVVPVKRMAQIIDTLRNKRSRISDWPDVMPFDRMTGQHQFTGGMKTGQVLRSEIDHMSLLAMGGLDFGEDTLDYDVTAMFKAQEEGPFRVSKQLAGIRWPLRCQGALEASFSDLCFSEDGAVAQLVEDIIKQDVKRRGKDKLKEAIEDKLPDNLKGITDDLLRGIFN